MPKRKGSSRRKSRHKMMKPVGGKSKISISQYFKQLSVGDKVVLTADSSVHKGLFFPRFYGKVGTIVEKQGSCYKVEINDINAKKYITVHPVHLKKI